MTAYVNVHGKPIAVSARDAVIAIYPHAVVKRHELMAGGMWAIRKTARSDAVTIGTGASKEGAWREAWSRVLAEEVRKEGA